MRRILIFIVFIILASSSYAGCPCLEKNRNSDRISDLEKQINESYERSIEIENNITSRNFFKKLFFGADWKLAGELEKETEANKERISRLSQLCESCSKRWEKENKRLYSVSVMESKKRGLFGWFKE